MAHNHEVAGSSPAPATKLKFTDRDWFQSRSLFLCLQKSPLLFRFESCLIFLCISAMLKIINMVAYMKKNENGFGAIEALLILVIVGLVGGIGYYVYQSGAKSHTATNTSTQTSNPSSKNTNDISNKPLLYRSSENDFEIELADGWELTRISDGRLYTEDMTKLVPKPGTRATVKDYDANSPNHGFIMWYVDKDHYTPLGDKQQSLKTNDGLTIDKYVYMQTESPTVPGLSKGSKSLQYYVTKGNKTFWVQAQFQPSDPDTHETIESVLKTLKLY